MDQYLTTAQVAEAANRSIRTVSRWISNGQLRPAMKIPGRTGAYLFTPEHVAEVLCEQTRRAA
jgi:DNA-binding transcriptional MerR regulator